MLAKGLVFEGYDAKKADKIKEFFGRYKLLRIVELGKPGPYPNSKLIEVPVKLKMEVKNSQSRKFSPLIRPVYGHSDRWGICGGI